MKKDKLIDTILKKAEGFTVEETVTEYAIDEEGNARAVRSKVQNKYMPPDVAAAKTYFELIGQRGEFDDMTDEELERERVRLLGELGKSEK